MELLSVHQLTKQFGSFTAVNDISFAVKKGEIVGLLGPNGAGKTTTIQMLLGLMTPTSGTITYFGQPFDYHRSDILQRINSTSGYAKLPWRLTVWENLTVYAHLYSVPKVKDTILRLAKHFEVEDLLKKKIVDLSAGQSTRVMLVKAFLNSPELLLLDEPTASLDPDIAQKIRTFILAERKRRNIAVLITSHNMAEVEEICDRVIFLQRGKIFAIDTPEGLARRNQTSEMTLMVVDGLKRLTNIVKKQQLTFTESQRFVSISLPEHAIASLLTDISREGIEYSEIEIRRPSLEDFFVEMSLKGSAV